MRLLILDHQPVVDLGRAKFSVKGMYVCTYRVFIYYCVFFEDIKIYSKLWFSLLSVCVHRNSCRPPDGRLIATDRVKKNHNILRKTQFLLNTLYLPPGDGFNSSRAKSIIHLFE